MSRHRVSPSPFLSSSSSSHTTQKHYTNSYTYSHPNLNFLPYTIHTHPTRNVVCPSGARFENRPHSTPPIRLWRGPEARNSAVGWHWNTHTHTHTDFKLLFQMPIHCSITRFEIRARRIDGVECGLFLNHAPLGQTTLLVG